MNPIILELAKTGVKGAWHWITRTLSILAVIGIGWAIYAGIIRPVIKPKPIESYAQKAEQINNIEHNFYPNKKIFGLGLTLWGWDIGIVKMDYPKDKAK